MKINCLKISFLILTLMLATAAAAVELRFDPEDGVFEPDEDMALSIFVDDAMDIRTIELTITYDPVILASLDGVPGALYDAAPCSIFDDFINDTPGECYGAAVTIGWDCWVTGPGELFKFTFHTLAEGTSPITVEMVRLYNPDGDVIADVTLQPTTVIVSTASDIPSDILLNSTIRIDSNPFRPAAGNAEIRFGLKQAATVDLSVYDLSGRRVRELMTETRRQPGTESMVTWDGRDDTGHPLPTGVYFYVLQGGDIGESRKVVLLR
jgi:hypothetical protein